MAGSYSADLRGRVLAAVEAGATPGAAARRFAVGRSTAYRWAAEARTEGRRAAKRMGGGPKPRISGEVEAALLGLAAGGEPPDPGRVPRPAGRADGRAGAPVDGGPGAAAVRLDVKEAEPARGRAGPGGRGRRARRVADGRGGGGGRGRAGAAGVPGRVRRADRAWRACTAAARAATRAPGTVPRGPWARLSVLGALGQGGHAGRDERGGRPPTAPCSTPTWSGSSCRSCAGASRTRCW